MRATTLLIMAASLLVASTAAAATVRVMLVIPSLPAAQANALASTRADMARGYMDVPAAARLGPRTSAASDRMLDSGVASETVSAVHVSGLGGDTVVLPQGGWACTASAANSATVELGYRFFVSGSARPGNCSWPVSRSIQGL